MQTCSNRCRNCAGCIFDLEAAPNRGLIEFFRNYKAEFDLEPKAINPAHVEFYENLIAYRLYETKRFIIELVILRPLFVFPVHRHPDIDSVIVYLSGKIDFFFSGSAEGVLNQIRSIQPNIPLQAVPPMYVDSETWHSARVGADGGAFINFEYWKNGLEPTCAGQNWIGSPMDCKHLEQLQ